MATLFKDIYNETFFEDLINNLKEVLHDFDQTLFLKQIYDKDWENRELKQRMRHISKVLKNHVSEGYTESTQQLLALISNLKRKGITEKSIEFMFIPDFIECYGLEYYDSSISALEEITQFTSCEFAIRPFIIRYEKPMIKQLLFWARHSNQHVRRLASEGCRPRLPWAMALPSLKKNPTAILPVLEILKNDESEYVRRSVANNLNDISKDNPDIVFKIATKWKGQSKEMDWIVKHACRTLLKQGNREVMQLFDFGTIEQLKIKNFHIDTKVVRIGESMVFSFTILNRSEKKAKIRLEYGIYYKRANGSLSRKVFKISEKEYAAKSETQVNRKHSFKIITTRTFYKGDHKVSLILNGYEVESKEFELIYKL